MNRFESLLHRKSTRRYAPAGVASSLLQEIQNEANEAPVPFPEETLRIELVEVGGRIHEASRGIIGDFGKNKAPHYLILSGNDSEKMRVNAGYAGEKLVLSLTAHGLATCWLGGHIKGSEMHKVIDREQNFVLAAMVAFGHPPESGSHTRPDPDALRRKSLEQLIIDGRVDPLWEPLLDAARRAPSALNGQPWRFLCDGSRLHCYVAEPGTFITRKFLGKIVYVDAGIMLRHIIEAAHHYQREIQFEDSTETSRPGVGYVTTVILS